MVQPIRQSLGFVTLVLVALLGAVAISGDNDAEQAVAAEETQLPIGSAPTLTPTKPSSSVQTRTPTPTRTPTATRTPFPTRTPVPSTSTATPTPPSSGETAEPRRTPTPPGVATSQPQNPGDIVQATARPTDLPVAVPSFTPTPLPFGVIPPTPTPPTIILGPVADLVVTGIEVTQGTQNLANQMPLVEGRWTAVRVYLKTQDPAVGIANVKGGLGAWRGGHPLGIIFADNAPIIGRPDGGVRTNVQDSLLFWLPPDWRSGEVHLKAMVYAGVPSSVEKEPNSGNNFVDIDVEFQVADPALIRLVPVHLHNEGNPLFADVTWTYQDNVADSLEVLLDAFRLLPIHEMYFDPSLEYLISFLGENVVAQGPVLPVGHSQGVEWHLDQYDEAQLPNAGITALKLLSSDYYQNWQWYGMVDPSVPMKLYSDPTTSINITGISNGKTAYGRFEKTHLDQPLWWIRGGMTLVHEMAHNIMPGPDHILCAGSEEAGGGIDTNYPYPFDDDPPRTCSMAGIDPAGYYGFDVYWSLWPDVTGPTVVSNDPAAPAPNAGFPLMGYKRPHWIDPYDYCKLLNGLGVPCDETAINVSAAPRLDQLQTTRRGLGGGQKTSALPAAPKEASRQAADPYIYLSVVADNITGTATIVETMPLASPPQARAR